MPELVDLFSDYYRWIEAGLSTYGKEVHLDVPRIFLIEMEQDVQQAAVAIASAREEKEPLEGLMQDVRDITVGKLMGKSYGVPEANGIIVVREMSDDVLGEETFHDIYHQTLTRPTCKRLKAATPTWSPGADDLLAHGDAITTMTDIAKELMERDKAIEFYGHIGRGVFQSYKKEKNLPAWPSQYPFDEERAQTEALLKTLDKFDLFSSYYAYAEKTHEMAEDVVKNLVQAPQKEGIGIENFGEYLHEMGKGISQVVTGKHLEVHPRRKGKIEKAWLQERMRAIQERRGKLEEVNDYLKKLPRYEMNQIKKLGTSLDDAHILGYLSACRFDETQWPQALIDKDCWRTYVEPLQRKSLEFSTIKEYMQSTVEYVKNTMKLCKKALK